ncbi:hypothetical protein HDU80_008780 [Chytriomyces hyalinus]|nr:hypothetical protein HDU80_008780 [Chytriomyces hyalinus]
MISPLALCFALSSLLEPASATFFHHKKFKQQVNNNVVNNNQVVVNNVNNVVNNNVNINVNQPINTGFGTVYGSGVNGGFGCGGACNSPVFTSINTQVLSTSLTTFNTQIGQQQYGNNNAWFQQCIRSANAGKSYGGYFRAALTQEQIDEAHNTTLNALIGLTGVSPEKDVRTEMVRVATEHDLPLHLVKDYAAGMQEVLVANNVTGPAFDAVSAAAKIEASDKLEVTEDASSSSAAAATSSPAGDVLTSSAMGMAASAVVGIVYALI